MAVEPPRPSRFVLLHIASADAFVLPQPTNACIEFCPQPPSSVNPESVRRPQTVCSQWLCTSSPDVPPAFGALALSRRIADLNPTCIYLHLPSKSLHDLSPDCARYVLETQCAIQALFRSSRDFQSQPSSSPANITLLFDDSLSPRKVDQYEIIFRANESFTGASAAAVLYSRFFNVTSATALWSGGFHIPPFDSTGAATNLEGLHLVRTSDFPSKQTLPSLGSTPARILAVAKQLPNYAGLFNAVPGFALHISQHCPHDTTLFYNMLASRTDGLLVSISDTLFWLFWPQKSQSSRHLFCHALWIAPLPESAMSALDVASWCVSQGFGDSICARQLPNSMLDLPVYPNSSSPLPNEHPTASVRNLKDISFPALKDSLTTLSKTCSVAPAPNVLHDAKSVASSTDMFIDNISGSELRAISNRQNEMQNQPDSSLSYGKLTGTQSRSESCSLLESKSFSIKLDSAKQTSQLSIRQQRFQRLLYSQQEKRVVENASTVSSLGQRGKRVRSSSDIEIGRQQHNKTPRNLSSHVYVGQAIRGKLRELEQGKPFFDYKGLQHCPGRSSTELANILSVSGDFGGQLSSSKMSSASSNGSLGQHGIEFLFDGDERDRIILDYETLLSKSGAEFKSAIPINEHQRSKLTASIVNLRRLGQRLSDNQREVPVPPTSTLATSDITPLAEAGAEGDLTESTTETLERVLRAFLDGQVIVKDESLRASLMKAASLRL